MREKAISFFNEQAQDYDSKYKKSNDVRSFIFSERKRIVLEMLGRGDLMRILDIGCGPGVYANELAPRCRELYGVDPARKMIELARFKRPPNAEFSVGGIENLGFADNFFDAAICVGVLEYLEDVERGIEEVARVTKRGGIAIFTAPNAESLLNKLDYWMRVILKLLGRKIVKMDLSMSFMDYDFQPRLLSKRMVESALARHHFRVEVSRFHIFRLSFLNRITPRLSLFLAKRLNFSSNRFFAVNYIVKARKI